MSSAPSSSRHNVSETESLIPSTQTGEFWELVEKEEPMEKEETVEKGRLENISQEGTWLEVEKFSVNGETVERKKGENLMQSWRKMRQEQPDLFKDVVVWQQPAARVDTVLCHWARGARGESEVVRGSK